MDPARSVDIKGTVDLQLSGTLDTPQGSAHAMLCADADLPNEATLQWVHEATKVGFAVVTSAVWTGAAVRLTPKNLHRLGTNGGIQPAVAFNTDELNWMRNTKADLARTAEGLTGSWSGPGGATGLITLKRLANFPDLVADRCVSWADFKGWADTVRAKGTPAWFRGQGSIAFPLRTSLHRLGRHRLERYCYIQLVQFHSQAEAALNRRFDMNDPYDYATVIGLARHHGMPTPLLDWTASPYIAAFFALADALELRITPKTSDYVRIYGLSRDFVEALSSPIVTLPWAKPYTNTLSIGPLHNPRLAAQQGHFLVTNVAHLEAYIRTAEIRTGVRSLFAVDVPIGVATEALKDLAFMGLTAATLFPGLDGVGRMLRHEMSYDSPT
jgi:hypothetical protein